MEINKQSAILIIIVFILGFIVLFRYNGEYEGRYGETVVDTLKITHIDTNWFDSVRVKTITKIEKVQIFEYPEDSSKVYRYTTNIEDSLITGNIITGIKLKDTTLTLLGQYIDYIPKFPKYIHRTDSIIITKETFLESPKKIKLAIGLNSVLGKEFYGIGPSMELQLKEKININAGYDLVNKGITFGLHIPILNK